MGPSPPAPPSSLLVPAADASRGHTAAPPQDCVCAVFKDEVGSGWSFLSGGVVQRDFATALAALAALEAHEMQLSTSPSLPAEVPASAPGAHAITRAAAPAADVIAAPATTRAASSRWATPAC